MIYSIQKPLALFMCTLIACTTTINTFCDKNSSKKDHRISFVSITEEDINRASCTSKKGLVLDKPGTNYRLCENVNWKVKSSDSAAITLAAKSVTLDLNGHTITQGDTSLANNIGIQVQANTEFATIKNGTLQQMSLAGIFVNAGASCISIDSIEVNQSSYNGSFTLPFPPLGDLPVAGSIAVAGDPNNYAHDIAITNISCCDNGILNGAFSPGVNIFAIGTFYANDITVKNLRVDKMYGNNFSAAAGFSFGSGLHLSGLTASNLTGNREALGITMNVFNNSLVEDIQVSNVTLLNDENAPQTLNPAGAEGAKYTSTENFVLRRASFEGIEVVSTVPVDHTVFSMTCNGMSLASFDTPCKNGLIQDVTTVGVHSDGALIPGNNARACGYSNDGVDNVTYENVSVSDVSISLGHAFGFGSKISSDNPLRNPRLSFVNCTAKQIEVTGTADYAAGFLLSADQEQVINSTADHILDARTNPKAYGIILEAFTTGEANRCIIRDNTLTNCSTYGLFDNTKAKNSLITGNYAALNGSKGKGPNYFGLNCHVPLVLWKPYLCSRAPKTPSSLGNLDIQN